MGVTFERFNTIETNKITINNLLETKNVKLNDGDNHLVITNNEGQKLFWVDNSGANITCLDKAVFLEDVVGFPKLEEGLLSCDNNKLSFKKDLILNKLNVIDSHIENLLVDKLTLKNLSLPTLSSNSILNKILNSDSINSVDAKIININNDNLISKNITADDIKCKTINVELFTPNEINTDNLISNTLIVNKGKFNELEADEAGIVKLECKNIMSHNLDIIEIANIKLINSEESYINDLKACNADIKILNVNKIIKPLSTFGSLTEPLKLNMIDTTELDCNNEQNNILIYNEIVNDTLQNKFKLINLANNNYNIITKCHNQFINVNYNLCQINNEQFLFCKFIEKPKNLILEIILEPI
tara:strand:- start:603 stop:1676 length:1074 start_codon:yes stop_codon:yes gene_type:complete